MPTAAQLSAAILALVVNGFADRPQPSTDAPLTLGLCALFVAGFSLGFGDRLDSLEFAGEMQIVGEVELVDQLLAGLPWGQLAQRGLAVFELAIQLLALALAILSRAVWRSRGRSAASWVAALLFWFAAPSLFDGVASGASQAVLTLLLIGAALCIQTSIRTRLDHRATHLRTLTLGAGFLASLAACDARLGLTACLFSLGSLEPWLWLHPEPRLRSLRLTPGPALARLVFALGLALALLLIHQPFALWHLLEARTVEQWTDCFSAVGLPVCMAALLATGISIVHPGPAGSRGRWPLLLMCITLAASAPALPELLCLAICCLLAAGLPIQIAQLCPDHPRLSSCLATLVGLALVISTALPYAQARWSLEPQVLTEDPRMQRASTTDPEAEFAAEYLEEHDGVDVWEKLTQSTPDSWAWNQDSHSAAPDILRTPVTTLPQDALGRAAGYRQRELASLKVPGDVFITSDPSSFRYWRQRQDLEGLRPDLLILWAGQLPPERLLELSESWAARGKRILCDSFTLGGQWPASWAVENGTLFWFLFSETNSTRFRLQTDHAWPQHDLDQRSAAERARYLRFNTRARESFAPLALSQDEVARFQDAVQIAKAMSIADASGLEMRSPTLSIRHASADSACDRAHAGDLLASLGAMRRGLQLLDEASQDGCIAALGAQARWRFRAGQQTAAWADLATLRTAPSGYEELRATWAWLLRQSRVRDAEQLRALADGPEKQTWLRPSPRPRGNAAWEELSLRLQLASRDAL